MVCGRSPGFSDDSSGERFLGSFSLSHLPEGIPGNFLKFQEPLISPDSYLTFKILQHRHPFLFQSPGWSGQKESAVSPGNREIVCDDPFFPESKHPVQI
jgi:hypothetical protein